jgi:hypothetical protein
MSEEVGILTKQRYGKDLVRVARVVRDGKRHTIVGELAISRCNSRTIKELNLCVPAGYVLCAFNRQSTLVSASRLPNFSQLLIVGYY